MIESWRRSPHIKKIPKLPLETLSTSKNTFNGPGNSNFNSFQVNILFLYPWGYLERTLVWNRLKWKFIELSVNHFSELHYRLFLGENMKFIWINHRITFLYGEILKRLSSSNFTCSILRVEDFGSYIFDTAFFTIFTISRTAESQPEASQVFKIKSITRILDS